MVKIGIPIVLDQLVLLMNADSVVSIRTTLHTLEPYNQLVLSVLTHSILSVALEEVGVEYYQFLL